MYIVYRKGQNTFYDITFYDNTFYDNTLYNNTLYNINDLRIQRIHSRYSRK